MLRTKAYYSAVWNPSLYIIAAFYIAIRLYVINTLILHMWAATSLSLQEAHTDLIHKQVLHELILPIMSWCWGDGCMFWVSDAAAKPTWYGREGLEMPAQSCTLTTDPIHNSDVHARGRICWHVAPFLLNWLKEKSLPLLSFSAWTQLWAHKTHEADENTASAPSNLQSVPASTLYSFKCFKACNSNSELKPQFAPFYRSDEYIK